MSKIGTYAYHTIETEPWYGEHGLIVNVFLQGDKEYCTLYFFDVAWGDVCLTYPLTSLIFVDNVW